MSGPYIELEQPLDETSLLCRGCLAESGEMKDMMEWGLTEDFYKFTDVQVKSTERISQLLCTACEDALERCKAFRSQCRDSDTALRNIAKKSKDNTAKREESSAEDGITGNIEPEWSSPIEATMSCTMYESQLVIMITAPDNDSKIYLCCPYTECIQTFLKKSNLRHHLTRDHNITNKSFTIDLQYYCSYPNCGYNVNATSNKWFSGRKFLNQHYNKVHKCKSFHCDICGRKFATGQEFNRHLNTCNVKFPCKVCNINYNTNERLLVHLMRHHPLLHKEYKDERKNKRKAQIELETKKAKVDPLQSVLDSPTRSFATQTLKPEENIKNDVTLSPWYPNATSKTDEISTQTVFEDLLSLKSQNSEDSLFFSETVSLSDIQTQTFPVEFGLSRSHKETITSGTQSPDLSMKETQTCLCLYESPKPNYKLFDSVSSSPASVNLTSTQTQTSDRPTRPYDALLSFNTIETQTCFDSEIAKDDDDM